MTKKSVDQQAAFDNIALMLRTIVIGDDGLEEHVHISHVNNACCPVLACSSLNQHLQSLPNYIYQQTETFLKIFILDVRWLNKNNQVFHSSNKRVTRTRYVLNSSMLSIPQQSAALHGYRHRTK